MNPTRRFSNRAANYVRFRPRYPAGLLPLLGSEIGLQPHWTIADVGSGTGISSEPFLKNGNKVIGIEPNDEMRQAAESALEGFNTFESRKATAEATRLENASVDAILAGQAFHWFDREASRLEFARILKPNGWVVLIWNRHRLDASAFARDYESLLQKHGIDYDKVRHDHIEKADIFGFFGSVCECRALLNEQIFDFQGLRGRLLSCSYMPDEGEPGFETMMSDLQRLFDEHQQSGSVRFDYDTDIYFGKL